MRQITFAVNRQRIIQGVVFFALIGVAFTAISGLIASVYHLFN